jgi:Flp pilus assembly protein TadG
VSPRSRGQAIVEMALILPLLLLLTLGGLEVGRLEMSQGQQDRATALVAQWAAQRPGEDWHALASHSLQDCVVTVDTTDPTGLITATSHCIYHAIATPGGPLDGITITSTEQALGSLAPQ